MTIMKALTPRISGNLIQLLNALPDTHLNRGLKWNVGVYEYFVALPDDSPEEAVKLLEELITQAEA